MEIRSFDMRIFVDYLDDEKMVTLTGYIQEPSREMQSVEKKPAVLILPGGAYLFTSDREAEPIALAYASKGFQVFVLRYSTGKRAIGCKPLKEASTAIGLIRENADKWNVIENQIITCGFSAGGHLSAWVGLCGENKPDAMILCYPAVELYTKERESGDVKVGIEPNFIVEALLGKNYSIEDAESLNLVHHIKTDSIPMFCWSTVEDELVTAPAVMRFAQAYADEKRPFELHMYQFGEHGLALSNSVTANGRKSMVEPQAEAWLDLSVKWFYGTFGEPVIEDKPYEIIPGLWEGMA